MSRLSSAIGSALVEQKDPDTFLKVKECLTAFVMTLEVTVAYHASIVTSNDLVSVIFLFDTVPPFSNSRFIREIYRTS